jgi:DNA anti-recombination protein RmuC
MRAQRSGGIAGLSRRRSCSRHVGFVEDMNSIGTPLKQAQSAYNDAHGKLSTGRGNLVGQAQKLRHLGVKPSILGNGLAPEHAR